MSAEHAEISGIATNIKAQGFVETLEEIRREERRERIARESGGAAVRHEVDLAPVAFQEQKWLSGEDITSKYTERNGF